MRIIVVSDTHGNRPPLLRLLDQIGEEGPFDLVIHLGDGYDDALLIGSMLDLPLIGVRGNCDLVSTFPEERIETIGGVRFLICHGNRYGVKTGMGLLERRGAEVGARVILYGHNHKASIRETDGILFVNPGAFVRLVGAPSLAILSLEGGEIDARLVTLSQQPQPQL